VRTKLASGITRSTHDENSFLSPDVSVIWLIAAIAWADTPLLLIYKGITLKDSRGMSIVFPSVCKTPLPGGPVPIPYPNLTIASDFAQGRRKVKGGRNIEVITNGPNHER